MSHSDLTRIDADGCAGDPRRLLCDPLVYDLRWPDPFDFDDGEPALDEAAYIEFVIRGNNGGGGGGGPTPVDVPGTPTANPPPTGLPHPPPTDTPGGGISDPPGSNPPGDPNGGDPPQLPNAPTTSGTPGGVGIN